MCQAIARNQHGGGRQGARYDIKKKQRRHFFRRTCDRTRDKDILPRVTQGQDGVVPHSVLSYVRWCRPCLGSYTLLTILAVNIVHVCPSTFLIRHQDNHNCADAIRQKRKHRRLAHSVHERIGHENEMKITGTVIEMKRNLILPIQAWGNGQRCCAELQRYRRIVVISCLNLPSEAACHHPARDQPQAEYESLRGQSLDVPRDTEKPHDPLHNVEIELAYKQALNRHYSCLSSLRRS